MKLLKFEITREDDNVTGQIDCIVALTNKSQNTAVRAKSAFSIETTDGFIAGGGVYDSDIDVKPGEDYELSPYARTAFDAFSVDKIAHVFAETTLYKLSANHELSIPVSETNGKVEKVSETITIEEDKYLARIMVWSCNNEKNSDVFFTAQIQGSSPIGDFNLVLEVELVDIKGSVLDRSCPNMNRVIGDIPYFEKSFYRIKKKDLKGLVLKFNFKYFSPCEEGFGKISEKIKLDL